MGRCAECGAWNSLVEERRGAGRRRRGCRGANRYAQFGAAGTREAVRRSRNADTRAAVDRHRRVRSRARRRHRARLARAARRRAGHRQVDAAAAGGRALRARGRAGALRVGRGVRASDQEPRRSPRRRRGAALSAVGNLHRAHPRRDRAPQAGAGHHRLGADRLLDQVPVGARQHRPGARGGHAVSVRRQGAEHPDRARRPRHEGRQPRRPEGRSSTSSTPCCTSRASAITRIASSAR